MTALISVPTSIWKVTIHSASGHTAHTNHRQAPGLSGQSHIPSPRKMPGILITGHGRGTGLDAYPTNTWRCIDNKWYYFNYDGYVQTNCYIKSTELDFYYWLGPTGAWDTDKDAFHPDITKYEIIKE